MREFAKEFYLSPAWRRAREYVFRRDAGLCVECGDPGEIVHHKTPLTPENIRDPSVSLGEDNLELLKHATDVPADSALIFDPEGNLIPRNVSL